MVMDDFEWGAIVQKIRVHMPDAEADQSYGLTTGATVDHYEVNLPQADQKLFVTRAPYQFHVTIQRKHLKEAFLTESAYLGERACVRLGRDPETAIAFFLRVAGGEVTPVILQDVLEDFFYEQKNVKKSLYIC